MMAAYPQHHWTEKEYLSFERGSDARHEYYDGNIYAMAGASRQHVRVTGNTFANLHAQLRDKACGIYATDMRVRVSSKVYTYPDIVVVCGEEKFIDDEVDTLLNPTLIIEVLSPSTEQYDRSGKFQNYQLLESLQEYLLISQDHARIERYLRQENNEWLLTNAIGLEAVLELPSIQCTLPLSDVYEKVEFQPAS